jgi:diguanylate cyclase
MSNRDPDHTLSLALAAIERLKALHLPADPPGYELFYQYARNSNPDLNRAINETLDADGRLSLDQFDKIYEEFFAPGRIRATLASSGTRVSGEIQDAIGLLDELIISISQSRNDCTEASAALEVSGDRDAVKVIANAIIRSLRDVEVRYKALEQRFADSRRELELAQQALAEISIESGRDALTGLPNRRWFEDALERSAAGASADNQPLSLLMIDIDNFKSFNDQFGHLVGDSVLRLVASALLQSMRSQDSAVRFGGEEFAIILPNTGVSDALVIAEDVRSKIGRRRLKVRSTGKSLGAVTVSIGAAAYRAGERAWGLVERADAAMYIAKRAGRNCSRCENGVSEAQVTAA